MESHCVVKWPTIVMEVNKEEKKVIIYGSVGHTVAQGHSYSALSIVRQVASSKEWSFLQSVSLILKIPEASESTSTLGTVSSMLTRDLNRIASITGQFCL